MTHTLARRSALTLFGALAFAPAAARAATGKGGAMPPVTIYHLEGRRSERIVWLMEELGLPYRLEFKRGDLGASMAAIRAINPIVPMAPTVQYGDQVLVESGAIIELILERHGGGRLQPAKDSADYPHHLMWMHYAEGSLAPRIFSDYRAWMAAPPTRRSPLVDSEASVQFAEEFLGKHPWFGGAEFSGADIMMLFPLNVGGVLNIFDTAQFPKVAAWKAKVEARPAYQRMVAKARPGVIPGNLPVLPKAPSWGPRK
ncbi:glutathione S-transferase family protein [uncultured Phenylobacterium sp.]|uniref:glutathione S-transferase family protein n=1 Tax=uncultured Phenylobacterium sp. TaxID=349273 RepID=UPI0025D4D354|nr:glutathione S-transferase family protein [uncultured Phenylobacterium sp.]